MNPVELSQGGVINSQTVDPITFLFHALHPRFGPLTEETRLQTLVEMLNFRRQGSERIDELITRFEATNHRAENEANFRMSPETLSFMLIRSIGMTDTQPLEVFRPLEVNYLRPKHKCWQ